MPELHEIAAGGVLGTAMLAVLRCRCGDGGTGSFAALLARWLGWALVMVLVFVGWSGVARERSLEVAGAMQIVTILGSTLVWRRFGLHRAPSLPAPFPPAGRGELGRREPGFVNGVRVRKLAVGDLLTLTLIVAVGFALARHCRWVTSADIEQTVVGWVGLGVASCLLPAAGALSMRWRCGWVAGMGLGGGVAMTLATFEAGWLQPGRLVWGEAAVRYAAVCFAVLMPGMLWRGLMEFVTLGDARAPRSRSPHSGSPVPTWRERDQVVTSVARAQHSLVHDLPTTTDEFRPRLFQRSGDATADADVGSTYLASAPAHAAQCSVDFAC